MRLSKNELEELRNFIKQEPVKIVAEETRVSPNTISEFRQNRTDLVRSPDHIAALITYMVCLKQSPEQKAAKKREINVMRQYLKTCTLSQVAKDTGIPLTTLRDFKYGFSEFKKHPQRLAALRGYTNEKKPEADRERRLAISLRKFLHGCQLSKVSTLTKIPHSSLKEFKRGATMFRLSSHHLRSLEGYKANVSCC